jgi:hypothetical protein
VYFRNLSNPPDCYLFIPDKDCINKVTTEKSRIDVLVKDADISSRILQTEM